MFTKGKKRRKKRMDQRVRYEWLDGWFLLEKDRWQDCAAAAPAAAAAVSAAAAAPATPAATASVAAAAVRCTSTRPCRTSSSAASACPPGILNKKLAN
jgi:hypothetical protein